MSREVSKFCEYVEGEEGRGEWGGFIKLHHCKNVPVNAFSLLGVSPLFVCSKHTIVLRRQWIYYVQDIEVDKLTKLMYHSGSSGNYLLK